MNLFLVPIYLAACYFYKRVVIAADDESQQILFMQIYKIMPIPKDTKKVTHKDYQTRQWPMLQPFPARTEKLERHIVLEKGFRKIQKTTCDFNIHFKKSSKICSFKIYHMVFCSSPLENLSRIHNNFSQTISNQYRTCAYSWM